MAQSAGQIVKRFYSLLFCELDAALEMVAAGYCDHNDFSGSRGPDALRAHVAGLKTTFPDFAMRVEDMVCDGDRVVTRVAGQGTHAGRWMDIEPTGRVVSVKGINMDRVENGLIVEHWGEADTIGMLIQMGVDPFAGRQRTEGTP